MNCDKQFYATHITITFSLCLFEDCS